MDMYNQKEKEMVLCAASAYRQKFYLNPVFERLPIQVKDELKIMCVLFTEEIGGMISLEFDKNGDLNFHAAAEEGDFLYDEIGSGLKIKQMVQEKQELLQQLQLYYKTMVLKEMKGS